MPDGSKHRIALPMDIKQPKSILGLEALMPGGNRHRTTQSVVSGQLASLSQLLDCVMENES